MQSLVESMLYLAVQLKKLKDVLNLEELHHTMSRFPEMMEEVVDFIFNWLKSWLSVY